MRNNVFISYSRRDSQIVLSYVASLRSKGVQPWMDQSGIEGASNWSAEIVNAIRNSDLVIVMCSPSSVTSHNVTREVALATEEDKPLLPVYLESVEIPSALRYHLAGIQYITTAGKDIETVSLEILRTLHLETSPTEVHRLSPTSRGDHPISTPRSANRSILSWITDTWISLPPEARLSVFFAAAGAPAWSTLIGVAVLGSAIAPRIVWALAFLFTLGLLFNLTGLAFAMRGYRRQGRFSNALAIGFLLNFGEAGSVLALGWLAYYYRLISMP